MNEQQRACPRGPQEDGRPRLARARICGLDKSIKTAVRRLRHPRGVRRDPCHRKRGRGFRARPPRATKITVVLDRTPFYAEMGGQVGDHGVITGKDGAIDRFRRSEDQGRQVSCTSAVVTEGELSVEDEVTASVDAAYRQAICRAHTCYPPAPESAPQGSWRPR